jgi:flagellum-specific ATP synthase
MKAADLLQSVGRMDAFHRMGKLSRVIGLLVESIGPPSSIGDLCYIHLKDESATVPAEVVGFYDQKVLLMPYGSLSKISPGCLVESTGKPFEIKVGDALIGSVLNSLGEPMDGATLPTGLTSYSIDREPPNPLDRPRILTPMSVGVRPIDGLLTVGLGQRVGIFDC